jgi:hypothetical protein
VEANDHEPCPTSDLWTGHASESEQAKDRQERGDCRQGRCCPDDECRQIEQLEETRQVTVRGVDLRQPSDSHRDGSPGEVNRDQLRGERPRARDQMENGNARQQGQAKRSEPVPRGTRLRREVEDRLVDEGPYLAPDRCRDADPSAAASGGSEGLADDGRQER